MLSRLSWIFSSQPKAPELSSDPPVPKEQGEEIREQKEEELQSESVSEMGKDRVGNALGQGRYSKMGGGGDNDNHQTEHWDGAEDDFDVEMQLRRERGMAVDNLPEEPVVDQMPKHKTKKSKKAKKVAEALEDNGDVEPATAVAGKKTKSKRKSKKGLQEEPDAVMADAEDLPNGRSEDQEILEEPKPKKQRKSKKVVQEEPDALIADTQDLPNKLQNEELVEEPKSKEKRSRMVDGVTSKKKKSSKSSSGVLLEDNGGDIFPSHFAAPAHQTVQRVAMSVEPLMPVTPSEDAGDDQLSRASMMRKTLGKANKLKSTKSSLIQNNGLLDLQDLSTPKNKLKRTTLMSETLSGPSDGVNKDKTYADDVKASLELLRAQVAEMDPTLSAEERKQNMRRLEKNHQKRVARVKMKSGLTSTPMHNKDVDTEILDASLAPIQSSAGQATLAQSSWTSINNQAPAFEASLKIPSKGKHESVSQVRLVNEDETPKGPSAKALGKRKAVDEAPKSHSKKRAKTIKDNGPPNRDLRTMLSDPLSEVPPRSPAAEDFPYSNLSDAVDGLWSKGDLTTETAAESESFPKSAAVDSSVKASRKLKSRPTSSKVYTSPSKYKKPRAAHTLPEAEPTNQAAANEEDSDFSDFLPTKSHGRDSEQAPETPMPGSSKLKRRKRRLPVDDSSPSSKDKNAVVASKRSSQSEVTKSQKTPKTPIVRTPQGKRDKSTKLTEEESKAIVDAVESYRDVEGLTQAQVTNIIHEDFRMGAQSSQTKGFWDSIKEQLPDMTSHKIMFFCRRKFHNFEARGSWTDEQDEELRTVYQIHPKRWADIGRIINRHPEDVRDRWRNYLVCGDHLRKDKWDDAEELRLKRVVAECLEKIRNNNKKGTLSEAEEEALLDWSTVSERLDHTRSRLQCSNKWRVLKANGYRTSDVRNQTRLTYREKQGNMKSKPYVDEDDEVIESNGEGPSSLPEKKNKRKRSSQAVEEKEHAVDSNDEDLSNASKKKKKKKKRNSEELPAEDDQAADIDVTLHTPIQKKKKKFSLDSSQASASKSKRKPKNDLSQHNANEDDVDDNGEGLDTIIKMPKKSSATERLKEGRTPTNNSTDDVPAVEGDGKESSRGSNKKQKKKLRERMQQADESTQDSIVANVPAEVEDVVIGLQTLKHNNAKKPRAKAPLVAPRISRDSVISKEKLTDSGSERPKLGPLSQRRQAIKDQRSKRADEKQRMRLSMAVNENSSLRKKSFGSLELEGAEDSAMEAANNGTECLNANSLYDMEAEIDQRQNAYIGNDDAEVEIPASTYSDPEEDAITDSFHDTESVDLDRNTPVTYSKRVARQYSSPPINKSQMLDYSSSDPQDNSDSDASSIFAPRRSRMVSVEL